MLKLSSLFLLIISLSPLVIPSECETAELVKNGGFEDGLRGWTGFSYCPQLPLDGVVTSYRSHSGRNSLFTECGTGGEHCFGVGGGARQQIQLNKASDLRLDFWVYLFDVPEINSWTDIALIADFRMPHDERTLVYYLTWADNILIYNNFPLPALSSKNVSNLLLQNLRRNVWIHVERDLKADFEKGHPDMDFDIVQNLTVTLLAVTFQRLSLTSKGAFWDDVKLAYKQMSEPTSTVTPNPVEFPSQTQPAPIQPGNTVGPVSAQNTNLKPDTATLVTVIIAIFIVFGVFMIRRKELLDSRLARSDQTRAA
jgi:hypothetical protein